MNIRRVMWGLGSILVFFAAAFIVPFITAFAYDLHDGGPYSDTVRVPFTDIDSHIPRTGVVFLISGLLTATAGLLMQYWGVEEENLRPREGYAIVGIGWFLVAVFGAIPFWFLGGLTHPVDAFFESMSGFTTTGASVMASPLDQYAPSLMMWRAFIQWVGGMGIIVLSIALLAQLTQGGHNLMSAETPGLKMERLRPKIAQTAKALYGLYFGFSAAVFVLLLVTIHFSGVRLGWYDATYEAMLHTFTTLASGGFSNHDASIAYFDSFWVELVIMVGMVATGISFTLHYTGIRKRDLMAYLREPEMRFFFSLIIGVSLFVSGALWQVGEPLLDALRAGFLQSISIITTTGYTPYVFDEWPDSARLVLLFMFFTGGMAGSTSGAMKVIRILVLFKLLQREIRKLLHPRAVVPLRIGKTVLNDDAVKTVSVFFFTYVSLFIFATIAMTMMGLDLVSAISGVASALGNIGPALGSVHLSYAHVPYVGKLLLALLMWAGRLEVFTVLILFFPSTWRR
ncbi:MAG: TrkH family potassium uptake protein [Euryarchaeota archaeon]|nr:TrkH family potassium uptake protein [Euryarchaeota archaeon]